MPWALARLVLEAVAAAEVVVVAMALCPQLRVELKDKAWKMAMGNSPHRNKTHAALHAGSIQR